MSELGRPKPSTRQIVMPQMTPKLVLNPNTCDVSAGMVSLRKRLLATMRQPQANPNTNLKARIAYVLRMSRQSDAPTITKLLTRMVTRLPFLSKGVTANEPNTSPKIERLEMAVLIKSVFEPHLSFWAKMPPTWLLPTIAKPTLKRPIVRAQVNPTR